MVGGAEGVIIVIPEKDVEERHDRRGVFLKLDEVVSA